jgi:Zn-finger nucleic acid-binding protein/predicted RNA-binding Zn-ribbon protein involved in translation (DUF1610 family)
MNVPEAIHCSGCGWELGLEPVTAPGTLACPTCGPGYLLSDVSTGTGTLHDCAKCGGQLVPHAPFRAMLESREWVGEVALQVAAQPLVVETRVHYVPCPVCAGLMARKNFGKKSHVIVDVCKHHGVWFDAGELPRVLAFVRSGGLRAEGAREGAAEATTPASRGIRYTEGVEQRAPEHPQMASYDGVTHLGREILDGLLDGLFGHGH